MKKSQAPLMANNLIYTIYVSVFKFTKYYYHLWWMVTTVIEVAFEKTWRDIG